MRGLAAAERDGGWCLARATAFVILAAATAETLLVEAFDGFLAPPALGFRGREAVVVEMELSMAVALAMPCLVSCEGVWSVLACWSAGSLGRKREGGGGRGNKGQEGLRGGGEGGEGKEV